MKKTVIFVSNVVGNGGVGRVLATIANYFVNQNIDVSICSFLENYDTYYKAFGIFG